MTLNGLWLCRCCFSSVICFFFGGFWYCSFSTCLALDVNVSLAIYLFFLLFFINHYLFWFLWLLLMDLLWSNNWMDIYFTFLFSSYAALFLSRDSGCKNTLIWVFMFFTHKHQMIVLRVAVGHSDGITEGGHQIGPQFLTIWSKLILVSIFFFLRLHV